MAVYGNTSSTARYLNNCGVCHPLDTARDNDGSVQVELFNPLAPASSLKARSTAAGYSAGTCTNVYCHSDGSTVATAQSPASPPVAWSAPTLSCGSCHGNPPAYQSGSPKANSHARHDGYSCSICHATTTADGTTIADQSRHVSGAYDLAPGANTTFAYSFAQAGGSCSANSCHSDGTYPRSGQVSGSVTIQWGGAAPSCSGCHGNPPLHQSAETRLNSHQSHTKYSCSACHYLVTSNGSSITNRALHANGAYDLAPSPTVAFTAQRYVYSYLGNYTITCNNSSCHNDGTATATGTPVLSQAWTTWGYVGLNCGSCHGNPPAYATGVPKKNSHSRHTSYGCQACHYSVTTDGTTIADRVLHVNNSYEVTPSPGNTFIYIFATTGGSCSGVSCHNDGTGVATGTKVNANPSVWGAAFSCASCHGNPPAYANGSPKKNSHLGSHAGIGCQLCHAAVTTTGYSITTPALHNNNQYNVTAGTGTAFTYTYSATGGTCTNISCHSDGTSIHTGTTRSNSVAWGVATLGCSGCHGNPPAYPNYSPKGNDHNRAGHASLGCQVCHYTVTSNGTGITDQSRHKNGVYDVSAGPTTFFIYSSYPGWYGRCRNVTCHGDGTAVATGIQQSTGSSLWVNITDCSYCHTAPPAYISGTPKKNSHTKHWQSIYYCRECHYSVMNTTSNSTVTTPANHKNGQYNVSSAPGRTMTYLYSPTGGSCSATTCHSDGTSVATGTLRGATTVAWGGVPMTCSSCHAYPPLYPTGSPKKNSHAKHQGYGCQECHGQTTYNGTTVNGYYHINGQYSLYGQRIGTYTYNANGGNCSNVKCHSDGTYVATGTNSNVMGALTWGANLTLTCTACHSMPPAYTNGYPKGNSHGLHSALSIGCRACHASVTANGSSILDRSKHANGSYDVAFVNSTTSFTYTYRNNGSSCGDVACHPAGKKNINWSIYAQAPVTFSPINNENYAPVDLPVKVVFTDDIDPATITAEGVFTLTNDLIPVAGTVSYDVATKTASFNPSVPLDYSNPYTARLANTVKNLAGQPLQNSYAWSFTTTNSPNFTYLVNSNFDQFSLGYLNTNSPSGGGYWNVITPGWNGSSLSSMNQGYAKVDEATKIDAQLDTQVFDLSAYQSLKLGFTYNFKMSPPSVADVDISFNGSAGPWTNIWKRTAPYANYSYQGSDTLNLSTMAKGQPNVKIRFRFTPQTSSNTGWWALDNVYVGADPR
jgi:predicted CxxxxCH...CXXCH cytochrome family protein